MLTFNFTLEKDVRFTQIKMLSDDTDIDLLDRTDPSTDSGNADPSDYPAYTNTFPGSTDTCDALQQMRRTALGERS